MVLERRNLSQFGRRYQKILINVYRFSPKDVLLRIYYNQINPDVHEEVSAKMFITISFGVAKEKNEHK